MRQKKTSIYISILLAIVSLGLAVLFRLLLSEDFLSNVFLGVFGSAFVTLVVFCYDYSAEKHRLIREYCKKVDEIYACREHVFMIDEIDGTIPNIYYEKTGNISPIDRLCDLYIRMDSLRIQLTDLFVQIDYFLDFPIKQWFQDRNLILVDKGRKFKTKIEKRLAKEEAKALYRDEYYSGKRKKIIGKRIQTPLIRYLRKISGYASNEFSWYREGLQVDEETVIKGLLDLQSECSVESENGVSEAPARWHDASGELMGTLVGSKVFWLKEKANGHQETD